MMRRITLRNSVFSTLSQDVNYQVPNGHNLFIRKVIHIGFPDVKPINDNYHPRPYYFGICAIPHNNSGIFLDADTYTCWICFYNLGHTNKAATMDKVCIDTNIF